MMDDSPKRRIIHWFSPLPPARTDIAEYTRRILPTLSRQAQVVLWTDQTSWDHGLETYATVRTFNHKNFSPNDIVAARHALNIPPHATDSIFIHIGNNWLFHAGLLAVAQRVPAIIVLHDLVLQEMFLDSVNGGKLDRSLYLDGIERSYGVEARTTAREALSGKQAARSAMLAFPGLELVTRRSLAIVAHSAAAHEFFRDKPPIVPFILNLPFPHHGPEPASSRRVKSGPVRLAQFGHIGPNRRVLEVLDALGALKTQLEFRFDIVGQVWDEAILRKKVAFHELQESVRFHGYLSEAKLNELISEAHLVFNLRYPTMGEASGSQLRIWSLAGCSVVSNHGWYASLPENSVLKIPIEAEAEQDHLQRILLDLGQDRSQFEPVGKAGAEHLRSRHGTADYADAIYSICDSSPLLSRDLLIR